MKLSAPAISDLSWLNPTPHAIAVYASSPLSSVATQHSLPSRRYSLLGPDLYVAPDVKRFFWTWHRAVRIRLVWDFLCQGCITPFLSCFVASFFVRPAPRAFFRPDRILPSPSRTVTVKDGACMGLSLSRVHHAIFVVLCCFILCSTRAVSRLASRRHIDVAVAYHDG